MRGSKQAAFALALVLGCGSHAGSPDGGGPHDGGRSADAGGPTDAGEWVDAAEPRDSGYPEDPPDGPPPVGPPGSETRYEECAEPRRSTPVTVRAESTSTASGDCLRAMEGRVLDIRADPATDGVVVSLHHGFDGGDEVSCTVTVEGIGADVAGDIAWARGLTFAAFVDPGEPGQLWLADGEGWWTCEARGAASYAYPLVLQVGGGRFAETPADTGTAVGPAWGTVGCVRDEGECRDFELGYDVSVTDRSCRDHHMEEVWSGETEALGAGAPPYVFRVLRGPQTLTCPVPGTELTTDEYPPGAWALWSTAPY